VVERMALRSACVCAAHGDLFLSRRQHRQLTRLLQNRV
jgi:hypothetical protein